MKYWLTWLGLLLGCSAASTSGRHASQNTSSATTLSGACAQHNLTRPCQCNGAPGRQTCDDDQQWSSCECAAGGGAGSGAAGSGATAPNTNFAGNQRSDIKFVWLHTPAQAQDGSCLPGAYEGNFQGIYYSILAPSGLGVPIANLEPPDAPSGFHFTVEPAQGGETVQRVKGTMAGTADGTFPFTAEIQGALDCKAASFTAQLLSGQYSVLTQGLVPQSFDGVMSGHYDKRTHTFVDGQWDVRETSASPPGMLAPSQPRDFKRDGYGGSGQWAAGRATELKDPTLKACPANYTCKGGPLGPNKLLCNGPLGVPACVTDAECANVFPGEGVPCLKASTFSLCLRECKP